MVEYNSMPENTVEINDYKDFGDYFTYQLESEYRQPHYNNNFLEGSFNLRIYWINKSKGLGYGIADDWKNKKIVFYKFGSKEAWKTFKIDFASQFQNDNS